MIGLLERTRLEGRPASSASEGHKLKSSSSVPAKLNAWQQSLAQAISDPLELLRMLDLDSEAMGHASGNSRFDDVLESFPLRVPKGFISRMRKGDPNDPLLRQVLPLPDENDTVVGFSKDPLEENDATRIPGLLHKYSGRVLLVVGSACGVHCRYCFRRYFPYVENTLAGTNLENAISYIAKDPSIAEVIFSGGDPLAVSDARLSELAKRLASIPHVKILRIHSRMPIILPERVDEALLAWFTGSRLKPVLVVHSNHANELDVSVETAMGRLRAAGVTLLNQSVLLKGVNDTVDALCTLSERVFEVGALPYYLHALDRVQGASHFYIDDSAARELVWGVMQRVPGYLVPRLVKEVPGFPSKMPLCLAPPLAHSYR